MNTEERLRRIEATILQAKIFLVAVLATLLLIEMAAIAAFWLGSRGGR